MDLVGITHRSVTCGLNCHVRFLILSWTGSFCILWFWPKESEIDLLKTSDNSSDWWFTRFINTYIHHWGARMLRTCLSETDKTGSRWHVEHWFYLLLCLIPDHWSTPATMDSWFLYFLSRARNGHHACVTEGYKFCNWPSVLSDYQ